MIFIQVMDYKQTSGAEYFVALENFKQVLWVKKKKYILIIEQLNIPEKHFNMKFQQIQIQVKEKVQTCVKSNYV